MLLVKDLGDKQEWRRAAEGYRKRDTYILMCFNHPSTDYA
jgi:hypothetical protein